MTKKQKRTLLRILLAGLLLIGAALLPAAVEHVQQPLELPRAGGVLARHDPEHQHLTGVSGR